MSARSRRRTVRRRSRRCSTPTITPHVSPRAFPVLDGEVLNIRAHIVGKELRLKQQYFWTAASLADIVRRFKNIDKPFSEFPDCEWLFSLRIHLCLRSDMKRTRTDVSIQLNDVSDSNIMTSRNCLLTAWTHCTDASDARDPRAHAHPRRRGGRPVEPGVADHDQHVLLHEPHRPSRSA